MIDHHKYHKMPKVVTKKIVTASFFLKFCKAGIRLNNEGTYYRYIGITVYQKHLFSIVQMPVILYFHPNILLELKVISFCHQYRARLACTSVQSDQALYCCLFPKIGRWFIPFKKFSRLRGNLR